MRVLLGAMVVCLAVFACGEEVGPTDRVDVARSAGPGAGPAANNSLELRPELRLVGLGEISEALEVERLHFEADLFILPEDLDHVGDAVPVRFVYDDEGARTELLDRPLYLSGPGAYRVLVRVRPDEDGISVAVGGEFSAPAEDDVVERGKAEPAPSPSEPAPSPSEPAPSPSEPAPSPSEPAPSPSEPAPSPSDGAGDDAEQELPFAEPAPSPSEGQPDDGRGKADDPEAYDPGDTISEGDPLFVRSRRAYEFYAGVVDVAEGDSELLVTWDVSVWLRAVLAEPLGLSITPLPIAEQRPQTPGFDEVPTDFRIDAR